MTKLSRMNLFRWQVSVRHEWNGENDRYHQSNFFRRESSSGMGQFRWIEWFRYDENQKKWSFARIEKDQRGEFEPNLSYPFIRIVSKRENRTTNWFSSIAYAFSVERSRLNTIAAEINIVLNSKRSWDKLFDWLNVLSEAKLTSRNQFQYPKSSQIGKVEGGFKFLLIENKRESTSKFRVIILRWENDGTDDLHRFKLIIRGKSAQISQGRRCQSFREEKYDFMFIQTRWYYFEGRKTMSKTCRFSSPEPLRGGWIEQSDYCHRSKMFQKERFYKMNRIQLDYL